MTSTAFFRTPLGSRGEGGGAHSHVPMPIPVETLFCWTFERRTHGRIRTYLDGKTLKTFMMRMKNASVVLDVIIVIHI